MNGAGPRTGPTAPDLQRHDDDDGGGGGGGRRRTRRRTPDAGPPKITCGRKSGDVIDERTGFFEEERTQEAKTEDTMEGEEEEEEERKNSASNDRDQNNAKADAALELDRFCCRLKLYADSVLRTQYRFSELLEDLTGSAFLLGCPPHLRRSSSSEEEEDGGGLGSRLRQTGSVELFQTTQTKGTFGILKDDVTADVSSNPGGCEAGLDVDVVNRMQQEERHFAEIPTEFKHPTQKARMTLDSAGRSSAPLWPQPKSSVGGRRLLSDPTEAEMHDNYSNAYKNSPTEGIYVAPPVDEQSVWLHKLNKYRCPDERLRGRTPEENVRPTKRTKLDDFSDDLRNNSTPIRVEEDPKSWDEGVSKSWPVRKRKDGPGYLSAEVVRDRYLSTVSTFARLSTVLTDRRRSKGRIDAKMERLKQELNRLEAAFLVEKARLEQDGRLPVQNYREARNVAAEVIACHRKDLACPRSDENPYQHPGKPFEVLGNDAINRTISTPSSEPSAIGDDAAAAAAAAVPTTPEPPATSSAVSVTRLGPGLVLPVAESATSETRNDPDEGCFQNHTGRSVFREGPEDDDDDDDDVAYRQLRRFLTYQPLCSTNLPAKDARGTLWDNAESNFETCSNFERSHAVTPEDRTCRQVASGCRLQFSCSNVGTGSDRLPSVSVHTRSRGATEVATCCNNRRISAATTGNRTASRDAASVLRAVERKGSGSIWRVPRPENSSWTSPFLPSTCCSIGASSTNLGHVTPTTPIFDDVTTGRDLSRLSDRSAPHLSHLPLPLPLPSPAHPQVGMSVGLTLSDSLSNGLSCGSVSYEHDVIVDGSLADVCYAGPRRWGCTAEAPQSPARYPHLMFPTAAAAAAAGYLAAAEHPGIRQLQRPRNPALDEGGGRWLCG